MSVDLALLILRAFAGLVMAAHGAQKTFGWWGGPGLAGARGMAHQLSFRPSGMWGLALAWGELAGGVLLALGLLTGLAAGVLVVDLAVAMWKVHWSKGFWNTKGGIEFPLSLAVLAGVVGLVGAGAYSLDAPLGLVGWTVTLFGATLVLGFLGVWSGHRPQEAVLEERRRRAA